MYGKGQVMEIQIMNEYAFLLLEINVKMDSRNNNEILPNSNNECTKKVMYFGGQRHLMVVPFDTIWESLHQQICRSSFAKINIFN